LDSRDYRKNWEKSQRDLFSLNFQSRRLFLLNFWHIACVDSWTTSKE
jgi:hypothetical protein